MTLKLARARLRNVGGPVMMIPRFVRLLVSILSVAILLSFVGCKTTDEVPEETPVEEPAEEPVEAPQPDVSAPEKPEPLSQEDINAAKAAVQRANLMGANKYFPGEYNDLKDALEEAIALGESNPDAARAALAAVIQNANALYDKTLLARRNEYMAKYYAADAKLLEIEADKFAPEKYAQTQNLARQTMALYDSEDYAGAQTKADETLAAQHRLYNNLSDNIRYVGILKRDTENYLGDAEDNEAFLYAPEELDKANGFYFDGVSAFRSYKLQESADILTEAKRHSVLAARTAAVRKRQAETDALMNETQHRIESASRLRVMNPDGTVSDARPWDGEEFIGQNPLVDYSKDVGTVDIENPVLKNLDDPVDESDNNSPVDVPIENEGTQVNADEESTDYLAYAENLWEKGVTARNNGQFDLAQDYFRQAQAYIDAHEANAVTKTYTVVYRKIATDCLWRIAERDDVFENPFLWPKIWRANRRIIQNPDLIYPGQILAIPPK